MIMERKIGEVFEYNGEWYQCVKGHTCGECSFNKSSWNCLFDGTPYCSDRSDEIEVIFKKLEKFGEPFTSGGKLYQHYKVFEIDNVCGDGFWCVHNYKAKTLTIEIKQTKEDMEEKKLNLKPFDIHKAREGKPVCTRDGRKARIICFDSNGGRPIVALVTECDDEEETPYKYHCDGSYNCQSIPSDNDLMMLPEKKEGWVNIYKSDNGTYYTGAIFYEKNDALVNTAEIEITTGIPRDCIDTINISWEE